VVAIIVALMGLALAAIGALGLGSPARLIALVSRLQSTRGLYAIAAVRLALGAALLLAAPESRAPAFLLLLGAVALLSGLVTPFFGVERFKSLLDWWSGLHATRVRAACVVVIALGLALVGSVLP